MGKRKRPARRSSLVERAVSAGRRALREAESRVPPDLRRRLERNLKDADKTARAAIKQLEAQVKRASTRADVNSVLKRIDGLSKQARQIVQGSASRAATTRRRATTTTRRAATRTRKAAGTAKRKAVSRVTSTTRRTTTRRAPATRSAASTAPSPRAAAPRRRAATRRAPAEPETPAMPETYSPTSSEGGGGDMGGSTET